jgi:transcriptional regulator with XRE-family HTH domain
MRRTIGGEIRNARLTAGMSLKDAGALVGMSHAQLGRIERDELPTVSLDQLARGCAAVGLRLVARAEVGAGPAVDSGQLAMLERVRRLLPTLPPLATEVPFPNHGDPRAWDAMVRLERRRVAFEAESRLRDAQALDRRCQTKMRDGAADVLILLVNDTPTTARSSPSTAKPCGPRSRWMAGKSSTRSGRGRHPRRMGSS